MTRGSDLRKTLALGLRWRSPRRCPPLPRREHAPCPGCRGRGPAQFTSSFLPGASLVTVTNRSRAIGRDPAATFSALVTWALIARMSRRYRFHEKRYTTRHVRRALPIPVSPLGPSTTTGSQSTSAVGSVDASRSSSALLAGSRAQPRPARRCCSAVLKRVEMWAG